ncbi:MAG: adenylate kinase [Candidatus Kapabacteria bacterium]|nr:adenylate kinase [Candidatus Kapabacteria bacterium]
MVIVLFGAPGVGKGTQAEILAEKLGIAHLSTGAAFRSAIQRATPIGLVAKEYVERGGLVPDDVVAKVVEEALAGSDFERGCILDGFPRTRAQAEALETMLQQLGRSIDRVVNIDVDDATIVARLLQRGRSDDREDVIQHRLDVYNAETAPLLDFYGSHGILVSVHGVGSVDEVNQRILDVLRS